MAINKAGTAPNPEGSAPFNMALATLEGLHNLIKDISHCSIHSSANPTSFELSLGHAQHLKYRLVKQLIIRSVPLLNKHNKHKENLLKEFNKIKLESKVKLDARGNRVGMSEVYSPMIDAQLDDVVVLIVEFLQSEGYFMPDKTDPRFTWKQD